MSSLFCPDRRSLLKFVTNSCARERASLPPACPMPTKNIKSDHGQFFVAWPFFPKDRSTLIYISPAPSQVLTKPLKARACPLPYSAGHKDLSYALGA